MRKQMKISLRNFMIMLKCMGIVMFYFLLLTVRVWSYEVVKIDKSGAFSGIVKFKGKAPAPVKMLISKDFEVCGKGERLLSEVGVSNKTGGLRHVVVYIEEAQKGKDWNHPKKGYLLDQKGCRFLPVFYVVPAGKELGVSNSDPVFHNIHAYEIIGKVRRDLFNVAQSVKGNKLNVSVKTKKSPFVKVECDAHNFMEGWVFIAKNPYYALTDEDGKFSIQDIPPGNYKVKTWHPVLGERALQDIHVTQDKTTDIEFQYEGKP